MRTEENQLTAIANPAPWMASSAPVALKVAIVGYGTVGSSVAKILSESRPERLALTHVCNRNIARKNFDSLPGDVQLTESFEEVLASDADIVVELIGGLSPAYDWVKGSL